MLHTAAFLKLMLRDDLLLPLVHAFRQGTELHIGYAALHLRTFRERKDARDVDLHIGGNALLALLYGFLETVVVRARDVKLEAALHAHEDVVKLRRELPEVIFLGDFAPRRHFEVLDVGKGATHLVV